MENEKLIKFKKENKTLHDYYQELVMLRFAYENNFINKDQMLLVRRDIEKSYGIRKSNIL